MKTPPRKANDAETVMKYEETLLQIIYETNSVKIEPLDVNPLLLCWRRRVKPIRNGEKEEAEEKIKATIGNW